MLQDEDYGSDSSDDDYVPTEAKESDEASSGADVKDSDQDEDNEDGHSTIPKKKEIKKTKTKSNRKENPLLSQLQTEVSDPGRLENLEDMEKETNKKNNEEDVWADFLADTEEKKEPVVSKSKSRSWASLLGAKKSKPGNTTSTTKSTPASAQSVITNASKKKEPENPSVVKITKIFDFAGEEVRVEEEVAADSKEALAAQQVSAASGTTSSKRSSSLAGLVSSLGSKKPKLSTLEKTKLDWQNYKSSEGLNEELLLHTKSKHTYLDKQEFLQRADLRQFEIERDIRQGSRKANR